MVAPTRILLIIIRGHRSQDLGFKELSKLYAYFPFKVILLMLCCLSRFVNFECFVSDFIIILQNIVKMCQMVITSYFSKWMSLSEKTNRNTFSRNTTDGTTAE